MGSSLVADSKETSWHVGDLGLIPGLGRFPWRREWQCSHWEYTHCSILAWEIPWTEETPTVQGVTRSRTWLKWLSIRQSSIRQYRNTIGASWSWTEQWWHHRNCQRTRNVVDQLPSNISMRTDAPHPCTHPRKVTPGFLFMDGGFFFFFFLIHESKVPHLYSITGFEKIRNPVIKYKWGTLDSKSQIVCIPE